MSWNADRLWELLPAVYRTRDATEGGGALRALVEVLARQSVVLEESLEQLYDDQFVETASPWVLPYIGDLLGIEGLPPAPLASRAEVGNTMGWRRRKGTAAALERIARDVTGLDARAVEFFELLAATQHLNHPRPDNRAWTSVRGATRLQDLGGPFERLEGHPDLTHTVDVRRIARRRGRYNIPNVGVFLWRLRAYRLSGSPAVAVDPAAEPVPVGFVDIEKHCFRFHPLGCDAPLFHAPVTEDDPAGLAGPLNAPVRISRRVLRERPRDDYGETVHGGGGVQGRSIFVERRTAGGWTTVEPPEVEVCDLGTWRRPPAGKTVSIDPVLGRLSFRDPQDDGPPRVTFHYGFAADLGGGEYGRGWPQRAPGPTVRVRQAGGTGFETTVDDGLTALITAINLDGQGRRAGVLVIEDGGRYEETLAPRNVGDLQVTVRARDGRRPTLVLGAPWELGGARDGAVTLDGLLVAGNPIVVQEPPGGEGLGRLTIRHCTLTPGLRLEWDGAPAEPPSTPSLWVHTAGTEVRIERSVTGPVSAVIDARVRVRDGILDATADDGLAYGGPAAFWELDPNHVKNAVPPPTAFWGAPLRLENVTVLGRVRADALELVSNTLLLGVPGADGRPPVEARRTQEGCVRFSYVPPGSRTPRRFQCRPAPDEEDARVRPAPLSTRAADPAYALIPVQAPSAVRRGADDEDEMGAYHLLQLARREAHLRARLEEYLRFGLEAGVFFIP
jgi:hypothetical protein